MTFRTKYISIGLMSISLASLYAAPALAHHPIGGMAPQTIWHGFLSGIAHPIIGFDHLAFILAFGLMTAFVKHQFGTALLFVAAMTGGTLLLLTGGTLPLAELIISASIVLTGMLVMWGVTVSYRTIGAIAVSAGLFHGFAFGAAVIGSETTPILAYLAGLAVVQLGLICGMGFVARAIWKATDALALKPRLSGALAAGAGLVFLLEHIESMVF